MSSRSRPLGVTLLCAFYALLAPVLAFLLLDIYATLPEVLARDDAGLFGIGGYAVAIAVGVTVYGIVFYAALYGLWTGRPWGWTLALLAFGSGAVLSLFQAELLGVLVSLGLAAYVYSKRDHYRRAEAGAGDPY